NQGDHVALLDRGIGPHIVGIERKPDRRAEFEARGGHDLADRRALDLEPRLARLLRQGAEELHRDLHRDCTTSMRLPEGSRIQNRPASSWSISAPWRSAVRRASARSATSTAKWRLERGWGVGSSARWTSDAPSRNQAPFPFRSCRSMGSSPITWV